MKLQVCRALFVVLMFGACGAPPRKELLIHAAASLTNALRDAGAAYQRTSGVSVRFNFGGSNIVARQIAAGAEGDIFFSADETTMDLLAKKQLIDPATRRSLLSNRLVVVVPANQPVAMVAPHDLSQARFERIALADPRAVPAGMYAKAWLEKTSTWETLRSRIVPTANVRAALAAVESGNADAAVVYLSDAMQSARVRVALFANPADTPPISYPVAVLRTSRHSGEARDFVDFLTSAHGRTIFEKNGFLWKGPDARR